MSSIVKEKIKCEKGRRNCWNKAYGVGKGRFEHIHRRSSPCKAEEQCFTKVQEKKVRMDALILVVAGEEVEDIRSRQVLCGC